jgi:hypothetical protein
MIRLFSSRSKFPNRHEIPSSRGFYSCSGQLSFISQVTVKIYDPVRDLRLRLLRKAFANGEEIEPSLGNGGPWLKALCRVYRDTIEGLE